MINEITVNSNNAIEMSRGELLSWLNDLLKMNLTKIEQLGTGAVYCQLFDILYPGKIALNKVNFKAKTDYEFINNFKMLQQCFIKAGIVRPIEIDRLTKCKYQDNLEFLQWFKKIFDSSGREVKECERKDKENRSIASSNISANHADRMFLGALEKSNTSFSTSIQGTDRADLQDLSKGLTPPPQRKLYQKSPMKEHSSILRSINEQLFQEEKEFYLRKFKEIEHLMETWDVSRSSSHLIESVRKIILVVPETDWKVQNGDFQLCQTQKEPNSQDRSI